MIVGGLRLGIYYIICFFFFWLKPEIKKRFFKVGFESLGPDYAQFGKLSLLSFGVKAEIVNPHNIDLSKTFVIVANHRSWLDQVSLVALYPKMIHFLANAKYWKLPLMNRIMNNIESIPVTRGGLNQKAKFMMNKAMKKNENILFFAEGTRGSGRKLLPFKSGAFKLAHDYHKEILPVYILGSEQCLSKKRPIYDIRPGEIVIVIGKPQKFDSKNYLEEMKLFEAHYRNVHDKLYLEFELYCKNKESQKMRPLLPSMRLV